MLFKKILLWNFILIECTANSQNGNNINTSYFDKNGRLTYVESAYYFRKNTDTANFYHSYYASNHSTYFTGSIISASDTIDVNNTYSGECKWFYKNGNLKLQTNYDDKSQQHGTRFEYYENGSIQKKIIYEHGKVIDKKHIEFDENGTATSVFEEGFSDNQLNWPLNKTENNFTKIRLGGLEIFNNKKNDYAVFTDQKIDSASFDIEVLINSNYIDGECKAGFIFGFKDWNNYNYYYISKFRLFIGSCINGKKINDAEYFFSNDLKQLDKNYIKISTVNDSSFYFVNNKLQLITHKKTLLGNSIGLSVTNGFCFFDHLKIAQYSGKFKNNVNDSKFSINNGHYTAPLYQICTGLLISNEGHVLTNFKSNKVNGFTVSLYVGDSLKEFFADIVSNNSYEDFIILKIRNPDKVVFPKLVYKCTQQTSIASEEIFITGNFSKNILGQIKPEILETNLKTPAFFNKLINSMPIFNAKGDLLALFNGMDNNGKTKILNIHTVLDVLFHQNIKTDIKKTSLTPSKEFKNKLYTNLVLIKTI